MKRERAKDLIIKDCVSHRNISSSAKESFNRKPYYMRDTYIQENVSESIRKIEVLNSMAGEELSILKGMIDGE